LRWVSSRCVWKVNLIDDFVSRRVIIAVYSWAAVATVLALHCTMNTLLFSQISVWGSETSLSSDQKWLNLGYSCKGPTGTTTFLVSWRSHYASVVLIFRGAIIHRPLNLNRLLAISLGFLFGIFLKFLKKNYFASLLSSCVAICCCKFLTESLLGVSIFFLMSCSLAPVNNLEHYCSVYELKIVSPKLAAPASYLL